MAVPPALPSLFVSHGSPMHALLDTRVTRLWRALGERLAGHAPRALLVASAHWETGAPQLSAATAPATIHDFGGFPEPLYQLGYAAPGAPAIAERAAALLEAAGLRASLAPTRGLDHGAWVPLRHLFPTATIPVLQLSVQSHQAAAHSLAVGAALAPLAREGVLVIGSGHLTHNLGEWMRHVRAHGLSPDGDVPVAPYVSEFSDWVADALARGDAAALSAWESAPHARRAHPSPEHFLPLLIAWAAAGPGARAERLPAGVDAGVLAMDAWLMHPDPDRATQH